MPDIPAPPRTTLDLTDLGAHVHGPQIIYVDDTGRRFSVALLTADPERGGELARLEFTRREHALIKAMLEIASERVNNCRITP